MTDDHMTSTLEWLRQDRVVGPATELGLISFPSYHSVSAILGAWAAWNVRFLRWPVLAIDAAMLASTPVQGSHYLVDVLAGVAVAVLCLAACLVALRDRPAPSPVPAEAFA